VRRKGLADKRQGERVRKAGSCNPRRALMCVPECAMRDAARCCTRGACVLGFLQTRMQMRLQLGVVRRRGGDVAAAHLASAAAPLCCFSNSSCSFALSWASSPSISAAVCLRGRV
jgi:hypothetical protein